MRERPARFKKEVTYETPEERRSLVDFVDQLFPGKTIEVTTTTHLTCGHSWVTKQAYNPRPNNG